ncbi:MAG: TolC family protein [Prevotella sp.]|jgi:outer membrane protein TolC|nr:TolC family protein [Prevotella sp.]MBO7128203.1 TolC family protein [Prevotella sp.]
MVRFILSVLFVGAVMPVSAQRLLTLDSCRAMALRNNKQMRISQVKQDVAANARKAARTKYLPHVSAIGTYEHTSREISLLNDAQKSAFPNLGTALVTGMQPQMQGLGQTLTQLGGAFVQMGMPAEQVQQTMGGLQTQLQDGMTSLAGQMNALGADLVEAFHTDTRNVWAGSILLTQPVFMGGAIIAMNKMADISESLAQNSTEAKRQATLYKIDQAYWQVVSLTHKKKLADGYLDLVKKLDSDVSKMIEEGMATRSEGLSVSVKVNEAEMAVMKVNDGLVLSRMLLCELCGLPVNEDITLADEHVEEIAVVTLTPQLEVEKAVAFRPELKMLQNTIDLSKQATNVLKAGNLPQVALTGGYLISNPSLYNGFEKKFRGIWNVGVMVRVPIWNWGDVMYKVRASKGATSIASLELEEAREMIELQVNQNTFRVDEANKKLTMANANIARAEENLRTATLGFKEGVITPTTVMEAQTAWLQAQSQKIDAEIDVKLSQIDLQKSLGTLE